MSEKCPENCPYLRKVGTPPNETCFCTSFNVPLDTVIWTLRCDACMDEGQSKNKKTSLVYYAKMFRRKLSSITDFSKIKITENASRREFSKILKDVRDTFPGLLEKETSTLLMNIFLALGSTERDQMISILQNNYVAESFIKKIISSPRSDNMLKDVRREMDDYTLMIRRRRRSLRRQPMFRSLIHKNTRGPRDL